MIDAILSIFEKAWSLFDRRTELRIDNAQASALQTLCCDNGTIFLSFQLTNLSESSIAINDIEISLGVRFKYKVNPTSQNFQRVRTTQFPINLAGKESKNVVCMVFVETEAVKPSTLGWYAKASLSGIEDVLFELPVGYEQGRTFANIHVSNPHPELHFSLDLKSSREYTTLMATAELLPYESFVRLLPIE